VHDTTSQPIDVHASRVVRREFGRVLELNGPDEQDRILSDSFSEDTPQLKLMDLAEPLDGMHCAFGSQLIYNRQSGLSLFMGALSADKLLTVFRFEWIHPNNTREGSPSQEQCRPFTFPLQRNVTNSKIS
jgi:alpha-galactosidase